MLYRAIGLMSGSSLDGLDIVFAELQEEAGKWSFEIKAADCYPYAPVWKERLQHATSLKAFEYLLLHSEYGHYIGHEVNRFIEAKGLHYQVALVSSHGHTSFHAPHLKMTAQLGDGAAIASVTGLPVVTDLRAIDVALGGQGAPIVPIGEMHLLKDYDLYLNLGGISNISFHRDGQYFAFDICAANRVLNMIAATVGQEFDAGGEMASHGHVHDGLLHQLNELPYYRQPFPKSLANHFGTDEVFPLVQSFGLTPQDALATYVQHVVLQIKSAIANYFPPTDSSILSAEKKLLVTGGGAYNTFLIQKLSESLSPLGIRIILPDNDLIQYKEGLIMAFMGVLRWRQEYNTLSSVTGAERDSIGGALWTGQEA